MTRRESVTCILLGLAKVGHAAGEQKPAPWTKDELLPPAELAKLIEAGTAPPILCVAFPVLYRQRHIRGSKLTGPTSKPEGIQALETAAASLPKGSDVVLYCGCCPFANCPNMRPAYETLKRLGFKRIKVLDIPTNMHTDWNSKGYPSESA